jgi:hypothetical protein
VDARVELHEFPKLGKGGVIMETFRHCDADMVGFVDADCATPPAELLRLADMPAHRPLSRRIASWIFARLTRRIFGLPFSDTQCRTKVVRRHVIEGVLPLLPLRDFLFDVDLLVTAERLGFRIIEVPTVWLDQEGSHVRAGADGRRMAVSSLRLWLHHRALPQPCWRWPIGGRPASRPTTATPGLRWAGSCWTRRWLSACGPGLGSGVGVTGHLTPTRHSA